MEAAELWKENFDNEEILIKNFFEAKTRLLMMTDGRNGASLLEKGKWTKMSAFPNKSIDDTGAGDAFVSGVVAGLLQGKSSEESLKMGLANGGSVVMKIGAKSGLLHKKQMEKWTNKRVKTVEVILGVI